MSAAPNLHIERLGIVRGRSETDERASEKGVPRGVGGGGRRPHLVRANADGRSQKNDFCCLKTMLEKIWKRVCQKI